MTVRIAIGNIAGLSRKGAIYYAASRLGQGVAVYSTLTKLSYYSDDYVLISADYGEISSVRWNINGVKVSALATICETGDILFAIWLDDKPEFAGLLNDYACRKIANILTGLVTVTAV